MIEQISFPSVVAPQGGIKAITIIIWGVFLALLLTFVYFIFLYEPKKAAIEQAQ